MEIETINNYEDEEINLNLITLISNDKFNKITNNKGYVGAFVDYNLIGPKEKYYKGDKINIDIIKCNKFIEKEKNEFVDIEKENEKNVKNNEILDNNNEIGNENLENQTLENKENKNMSSTVTDNNILYNNNNNDNNNFLKDVQTNIINYYCCLTDNSFNAIPNYFPLLIVNNSSQGLNKIYYEKFYINYIDQNNCKPIEIKFIYLYYENTIFNLDQFNFYLEYLSNHLLIPKLKGYFLCKNKNSVEIILYLDKVYNLSIIQIFHYFIIFGQHPDIRILNKQDIKNTLKYLVKSNSNYKTNIYIPNHPTENVEQNNIYNKLIKNTEINLRDIIYILEKNLSLINNNNKDKNIHNRVLLWIKSENIMSKSCIVNIIYPDCYIKKCDLSWENYKNEDVIFLDIRYQEKNIVYNLIYLLCQQKLYPFDLNGKMIKPAYTKILIYSKHNFDDYFNEENEMKKEIKSNFNEITVIDNIDKKNGFNALINYLNKRIN